MSTKLDYNIEAFDFTLPAENIAQTPAVARDASRLLVLDRHNKPPQDLLFTDIVNFLSPGDLLVVNDTKVFPARLSGKKESGGYVELFLLEYPRPAAQVPNQKPSWSEFEAGCLLKSSRRPKPGSKIIFNQSFEAVIKQLLPDGKALAALYCKGSLEAAIAACGNVPLPPYIQRLHGELPWDRDRYQTLFAAQTGAIAAPTAGLHFSENLLNKIKTKGVQIAGITLHVGYGTFVPVRVEDIRTHKIHAESVVVSPHTATLVNSTRKNGGKIWAVGTTSVRALEFVADEEGRIKAHEGWCDLYIYPGYRFKVVDNLITNFHLPRSSLLFLVSALTGRKRLLDSYLKAIELGYRFYSYGDAMAIIS